jgi:hypothetical protein
VSEWQWSYVEYPRTLHKYPDLTLTVHGDEAKAEALAQGWSLVPQSAPPAPEPEPIAESVADPDIEAVTPKKRSPWRKKSDD